MVGKPNQGLGYMFQDDGMKRGWGWSWSRRQSDAAYYAALGICPAEVTGTPALCKDPNAPMIAIINHPDIKRMLLFQRALVEERYHCHAVKLL